MLRCADLPASPPSTLRLFTTLFSDSFTPRRCLLLDRLIDWFAAHLPPLQVGFGRATLPLQQIWDSAVLISRFPRLTKLARKSGMSAGAEVEVCDALSLGSSWWLYIPAVLSTSEPLKVKKFCLHLLHEPLLYAFQQPPFPTILYYYLHFSQVKPRSVSIERSSTRYECQCREALDHPKVGT